jgi:mycothiol synthase
MTTTSEPVRLELPGMPRLPGLHARRFGDDEDFARLAAVIAASNTHDAIPWFPTADNLRLELDGLVSAIDKHADIVIVEVDGEPVAESQVWRVPRDGIVMYEIGGHVVPAYRRRGIGQALLDENVRRARERAAAETTGLPVLLGGFVDENEVAGRRLLERAGFEVVRHFFLMRRPALETVAGPPLPAGLEVRPVEPGQYRAIFDAEAEAFRDHWGHREPTEEDFTLTYEHPDLDTSLWAVAWAGDEVAGVVQTWIWPEENARLGVSRGWLERISVRRPWRRRGLGGALTAAAMIRLRERGVAEAMLGVDAANPTGALGLYERLGFVVDKRERAYRRELSGPSPR